MLRTCSLDGGLQRIKFKSYDVTETCHFPISDTTLLIIVYQDGTVRADGNRPVCSSRQALSNLVNKNPAKQKSNDTRLDMVLYTNEGD